MMQRKLKFTIPPPCAVTRDQAVPVGIGPSIWLTFPAAVPYDDTRSEKMDVPSTRRY